MVNVGSETHDTQITGRPPYELLQYAEREHFMWHAQPNDGLWRSGGLWGGEQHEDEEQWPTACSSPLHFYSNFPCASENKFQNSFVFCAEVRLQIICTLISYARSSGSANWNSKCGPFYMNLPHALQLHT